MNFFYKIILIAMLIINYNSDIHSQTYIKYSQALHYRNNMEIDSIFEHFEYPKLPEEIKFPSLYWTSIYVCVIIRVDSNYYVNSLDIHPLYSFGNDFKEQHEIWTTVKECIVKASKKWKFKPVYWQIPDIDYPELINHIIASNLKKANRPFGGKQGHFVIFHFINDIDSNDLPFLYQIRVE